MVVEIGPVGLSIGSQNMKSVNFIFFVYYERKFKFSYLHLSSDVLHYLSNRRTINIFNSWKQANLIAHHGTKDAK